MRKRIESGQVRDVTDPRLAESLVKEGSVTYQQAKNIAKAGNIDSIVFDVKSQAISCSFALVSGVVQPNKGRNSPRPDPRKDELIGILASKPTISLRSRFRFGS